MIIIKNIKIEKSFRYLWLKNVTGVNLSEHCAKCLQGTYSKAINNRMEEASDIILDDGIWYLCGVAFPFCWSNNFHLAFEYCEGQNVEYTSNGISIIIKNAKSLPISQDYIDANDPHSNTKSYCTCRNWQFAHYLNSLQS